MFLGDVSAVTLTLIGVHHLLLRVGWGQRGVPDGERGLPDGDPSALCIAFFAIGTAVGGITGPLLFGNLIENASASGDITGIAFGYFIGAFDDSLRQDAIQQMCSQLSVIAEIEGETP